MTVVLDNGVLRAQVTPEVGGSILSLRHVTSGLSDLGGVPWDAMPLPEPDGASATESNWPSSPAAGP